MTHCDTHEVDKRSIALRAALDKHVKKMKIDMPDADWDHVYEGWAIQKVADLQVLVLQLMQEVRDLRAQLVEEIQGLRDQLEKEVQLADAVCARTAEDAFAKNC